MPVYNPQAIEAKWQKYWEENKIFKASHDSQKPKLYVLDMFPYPSGEGLHVGHPEGYSATDMYCRYQRMNGYNVLHPWGYDAFGLPAEQFAIKTGTHPRITTERNIANIRRQVKQLGFSYDWDREFATTDPEYMHWTQWIFLLLFDTWFDGSCEWTDNSGRKRKGKGRPIADLPVPEYIRAQGNDAVRRYQDSFRLAYEAESPVNWCPELGTVLADEEVINGRSERGDYPVERIPLRQWMLRITAYADRLVEDLEPLEWPESIKEMQKNWVGRSEGAEVDFFIGTSRTDYDKWISDRLKSGLPDDPGPNAIRIYTTRPDTLFGATYMVLAPEHPLVDKLTADSCRREVDAYQKVAAATSEEDRIAGRGEKSGVFTGSFAINPVTGEPIPIWIADYVLISYGTGAIMAVPGHDQRDFEFARKFKLPIRAVVMPPDEWLQQMQTSYDELQKGSPVKLRRTDRPQRLRINRDDFAKCIGELPEAFVGDGEGMQSANPGVSLNGLATPQAKREITQWLVHSGLGCAAVKYKLRDWLFSRQRYWGEPIPILREIDSDGNPTDLIKAVGVEELPVPLPELQDFKPTGRPAGPLEKATDWIRVERAGHTYLRETNTMPQWAGSCWYYLRFCDPQNSHRAWDPQIERYWMPVDLYVGGAEHAVLHLLYSRFWHKVLFDRGYVSTMEPFQRLINQGMILSTTYRTSEGRIVPYAEIRFEEGKALHATSGDALAGETEKMSKSRGNVIPVDIPIQRYGADTTRLYEMFMGPLEATKPWSMQGVEGISRFLNRAWRMIVDEAEDKNRLNPKVLSGPKTPEEDQLRVMHKTIRSVTEDIKRLSFNTAISRLMEFVNYFTGQNKRPKICMENFVLLLSPMAPHIAEELWQILGHSESLSFEAWPKFDVKYTQESLIEIPIQINAKVRGRIMAAPDANDSELEQAALSDPRIKKYLEGRTVKKMIIVPKKLISIVLR